jgi:hypothetical protein
MKKVEQGAMVMVPRVEPEAGMDPKRTELLPRVPTTGPT